MASFCGNPLDLSEKPPHKPSRLAKSLYSLGNIKYRVGHNSLDVYAFEVPIRPRDMPPVAAASRFKNETFIPQKQEEGAAAAAGAGGILKPPTPLVYWVPCAGGVVHPAALRVSSDLDGGALFVGRGCVYGDLLPGKIAQQHRVCYVAHEGREIAVNRYEVLVVERGKVVWVPCKNGVYPVHALPAGRTLQGKNCYAVKARVDSIMTPGRLVAGERACRVSYNMQEFQLCDYEVLTIEMMDPKLHGGAMRITGQDHVPFAVEPSVEEALDFHFWADMHHEHMPEFMECVVPHNVDHDYAHDDLADNNEDQNMNDNDENNGNPNHND